jgi:hypothetical protein
MELEIVILDEPEAGLIIVADGGDGVHALPGKESAERPSRTRKRLPLGLDSVELSNPTDRIQRTISYLVKSIVQYPERVLVSEIKYSIAFEVKVALPDYELVVSKLAPIRSIAASADVSDGRQVLVHVPPI